MSSDDSLAQAIRLEEPVRQVSKAVRKVSRVVQHFPDDNGCYIFAYVGQSLLKRLKIEAEIHIGFAGWRLGPHPETPLLTFRPPTRHS